MISFIAIIFLFLKSLKDNNLDMLSYTSNIPFLISTSIILFLKNKKFGDAISKVLSQIGINSYGIYIFHQLFINIIYKLLKFDFIRLYPLIGFCIYLIFILGDCMNRRMYQVKYAYYFTPESNII